MNTSIIDEKEIDKIIEETKSIPSTVEKAIEKIKKENKSEIKNNEQRISLGPLGSHNCADLKDIDEVFDKLEGIVFKLKKCMFKVTFINKGQRRFTAEMINEKKN